ncbi:ABC transporter ATP-binding protein [Chitiniphilus purpureus]|uniref:ABC transporter ATP-binding protein n=1 Tax=Chitiniphilus purpureus TaxID=2981137 RepID=A0ABY6DLA3_9NEIS|nr:ABC transporter ATP-binding protein [Chitiniphilus sp. CD1]UXY13911.1 ABC transporter ATP-binding protein [Chitiniphilus sp. CD1]
MSAAPRLAVQDLTLRRGGRDLCSGLTLAVAPGERWLVLGENGSGKSTLLAALAGWEAPAAGTIRLDERPLDRWRAGERARKLAWLGQQDECPFPLTVLEKALAGRHPHLGRWDWESAADVALAQAQLARLDLAALAARDLASLSGGERRRAALAGALAQQAALLLLDEPLSQLDLRHQQQALAVLREESVLGRAVLLVSHDPNHGRGWATHALLLFGDGRWLAGPRATVLTAGHLSALYHHPIHALGGECEPWFVVG